MKINLIPAIYENGVLKPLEPLELTEHQTVYLSIEFEEKAEPVTDELEAWHSVFDGLSDEEIEKIETIVLDRDNFMRD